MQRERTMESRKQAVVRETAAEGTAALGADSESSNGRQGGGVRQMPVKPRQCGWHRQCRRDTLTRCTLQPADSLLYTL